MDNRTRGRFGAAVQRLLGPTAPIPELALTAAGHVGGLSLPTPDPLASPATSAALGHQARHGILSSAALRRALVLTGHTPARSAWRRFLDRLLLVLGAGLIVSGIIFFFAANWADFHRFAKLGMLEGGIAITVGLALWQGLDSLPGTIALTAAAGLVGALLAVYGQIYQTGADAYQLFALWALLITGWVLAGRFTPLWVLWLLLLNLTLWIYGQTMRGDPGGPVYMALFGLNGLALGIWEWARHRGIAWLGNRWVPRMCASLALAAITAATVTLILAPAREIAGDRWVLAGPPVLVLMVALLVYRYAHHAFDSFMLIVAALAACICLNTWIGTTFDALDEGILVVLGVLIVGQTAGVVAWVRRRALVWEARQP